MTSYPGVLQRVLGFLFWALIVLVAVAAVVSVYFVIWGDADVQLGVPVTFVPDPDVVTLSNPAYGTGSIVMAQGVANFEEVGGTWHVAQALVLVAFLLVPTLVVLRLLRNLVKTVAEGRPFQAGSVVLIRAIGLLVIASEILWGIATYLLERSVASQTIASGVALGANLSFNVPIILLGLVIVAIAEVFRYGSALQTDADLTV